MYVGIFVFVKGFFFCKSVLLDYPYANKFLRNTIVINKLYSMDGE